MIDVETGNYIKGMHNLMGAHFDLLNAKKLAEEIGRFERFATGKWWCRMRTTGSWYSLPLHIQDQSLFSRGKILPRLKLVPHIEDRLPGIWNCFSTVTGYSYFITRSPVSISERQQRKGHSLPQQIINQRADLHRSPVLCPAAAPSSRTYELGNFELLEYLTKSSTALWPKMESLSRVEGCVCFPPLFYGCAAALRPEFEKLLTTLKQYGGPAERKPGIFLPRRDLLAGEQDSRASDAGCDPRKVPRAKIGCCRIAPPNLAGNVIFLYQNPFSGLHLHDFLKAITPNNG